LHRAATTLRVHVRAASTDASAISTAATDSRHDWIAVAIAASLALVCTYSVRQADPDLFGYLSYGKLFSESGRLVERDPFAYTSAGSVWVSFEYGAQLLLWWAYHFGGAAGLIALKCLAGGATLTLLYGALRVASDKAVIWLPVFLLSTSAISRFFLFRPQLFTFAAFAAFVLVLFRHVLRRSSPLWLLPAITAVWANLHGGFVAGLGAIGLAIGLQICANLADRASDRRPRVWAGTGRLWATFVACLGVTLLNPHGVRLWNYILHELTHDTNRTYIAEWAPATLGLDPWSLVVLVLLAAILATAALAAAAASSNCKQAGPRPIWWALSCVPLLAMSFLSVRHLPLAALWTAPVIVLLASHAHDQQVAGVRFLRLWKGISLTSVVPASLTLAVVLAAPTAGITAGGRSLGTTNPCGAAQFLAERHLQGNLFGPLWWGSYITWRLHPDIRVSMDGRNVSLYPDDLVLENLKFYWIDARDADLNAPFRHDTNFLLVPTDVPIFEQVSADPRWRAVYRDPDSALFVPAASTATTQTPAVTISNRVACDPL
jgi:hypothetical protein